MGLFLMLLLRLWVTFACLVGKRVRKVSKLNLHGIQFLPRQVERSSSELLAKWWTKMACDRVSNASLLPRWFSADLASLMTASLHSKPINYSKAFHCSYSLANNVLFWQTILHPMHISGPHWTSFGCVMESRRRHQPIRQCSTAAPNFVPWWSDLMNNEWLQLTFKFIPSLLQGSRCLWRYKKGWKLTFSLHIFKRNVNVVAIKDWNRGESERNCRLKGFWGEIIEKFCHNRWRAKISWVVEWASSAFHSNFSGSKIIRKSINIELIGKLFE